MIIDKYNKPTDKIQQYNTETKRWLNPDTGNWVLQLKDKTKAKAYRKKYYENNKDKINEQSKDYRENNIEELKAYEKIYRENNKDKLRDVSKAYHETNRDKINEKTKTYYEDNKDKIKENHKLYRENNKDKIDEYNKEYNKINKDKLDKYRKEYRESNRDTSPLDTREHTIYSIVLTKEGHTDLIYIGETVQNLYMRLYGHKSVKKSPYSLALNKGYKLKHHRILFEKLERKEALSIETALIKHHSKDDNNFVCINIAKR